MARVEIVAGTPVILPLNNTFGSVPSEISMIVKLFDAPKLIYAYGPSITISLSETEVGSVNVPTCAGALGLATSKTRNPFVVPEVITAYT